MRSTTAFTLIEVLIVLSILSILAIFAFPSLQSYSDHAYEQATQTQWLQAIRFAQQEARARYVPIAICLSDNHTQCAREGGDTLLVFVDEQENGVIRDNAQILSVIQMKTRRGFFRMRSYPHYRQYLQFHPEEWNSGDNSTVWYCPAVGKPPAWAIVVNRAGGFDLTNTFPLFPLLKFASPPSNL